MIALLILLAALVLPLPLVCAWGPAEDRVRDWRRVPPLSPVEQALVAASRPPHMWIHLYMPERVWT